MPAETQHRKLLVVDDEPLVRKTLDFCLRDEYDVTTVASGEEAIRLSLSEVFPVVILDLRMEGFSGIETLKRLKQIHELQNVIILTAYESAESAITALNLGAFNYLTKPFERNHLREVISRGFEVYDRQTQRKQDMQQRLLSVHDSFLSLLCHEFNTPLNAILGFAELLSGSVENAEHKSWIKDMQDSGTRLHDILMEIVDYISASHLASTGIDTEFTLRPVFQPLIEQCRKEKVVLTVDQSEVLDQRLLGPAHSITTIIRKLIRVASNRSANVGISARIEFPEMTNQGLLRIVVSGTGLHVTKMMKSEIKQLFDPYQFNTDAGAACRTSLGLELATCRKIAEYAHGSVDCHVNAVGAIEFTALAPVKSVPVKR